MGDSDKPVSSGHGNEYKNVGRSSQPYFLILLNQVSNWTQSACDHIIDSNDAFLSVKTLIHYYFDSFGNLSILILFIYLFSNIVSFLLYVLFASM
jgi:hypothetical protein